ncbi:MAG: phosphoribosylanthranilate isomerase [Deltaproteobacteria bacterium]|nr:MAG: phosphoribosylanthranilate isomerase [Deltaproteobacteria bacterium]
MLVKICGITNKEDAWTAIEAGADALGFNFYPKSPRYLDPEEAIKLIEDIPPNVLKVGVFVNEKESLVRDLCQYLSLDYLQFHGDETPYYCEQFATPYWKAFRLKDEKTFDLMKKYHPEYFLIDAYVEKAFGGTGVVTNWDLAREAKNYGKVILAGGLAPENIEAAIRAVRPEGVDVASGVESSPGKKDAQKLKTL